MPCNYLITSGAQLQIEFWRNRLAFGHMPLDARPRRHAHSNHVLTVIRLGARASYGVAEGGLRKCPPSTWRSGFFGTWYDNARCRETIDEE